VAAVGIAGIVALYDRGVLPVAGVFVAMVLGPALIYLRRVWLARRLTRLRDSLDTQLRELGDPVTPGPGPGDARTVELVEAARRLLVAGDDVAAGRRIDTLVRRARDVAGPDGPRARQAAGVAATAQKLSRARRRVDAVRGRGR
jgi:hypothetical protein